MSQKHLLPLRSKLVRRTKHLNHVIQRLRRNVFAIRMQHHFDKRMHVWLGNVLYQDINTVFPCSKGFIVRGGYEALVLVAKGESVDGGEMVVIFLDYFTGTDIVLEDFFVGEAGEEFVLMFYGWVEANAVREYAHVPSRYYFADFGVSEFDHAVKYCGEKGCAG